MAEERSCLWGGDCTCRTATTGGAGGRLERGDRFWLLAPVRWSGDVFATQTIWQRNQNVLNKQKKKPTMGIEIRELCNQASTLKISFLPDRHSVTVRILE